MIAKYRHTRPKRRPPVYTDHARIGFIADALDYIGKAEQGLASGVILLEAAGLIDSHLLAETLRAQCEEIIAQLSRHLPKKSV